MHLAIDLGTTTTRALVSRVEGAQLQVLGLGTAPSTGVRKGVVHDVDAAAHALRTAVTEACRAAGVSPTAAHLGVAGGGLHAFVSEAEVTLHEGRVSSDDVARVLREAAAVHLHDGRAAVHVSAQAFRVDGVTAPAPPVGERGERLAVTAFVVTRAVEASQRLTTCVARAGLAVASVTLQAFAAGEAVLTSTEKRQGVAVVDMGSGTSELAVFERGAPVFSDTIALGGDALTHALAGGFRIDRDVAERLKRTHGNALARLAPPSKTVELPAWRAQPVRRVPAATLGQALESRGRELFELVADSLVRGGFTAPIHAGVVLTGGASQLPGVADLAAEVLGQPVRCGAPQGTTLGREWAATVGLALRPARGAQVSR